MLCKTKEREKSYVARQNEYNALHTLDRSCLLQLTKRMANYQLYRKTTLGVTLQETLNDMMSQGTLTEQAANKILSEFDRSINVALEKRVNKKVQFSGKLSTYRFCDNVWTLVLKDFVGKDSNQGQHSTAASTAQTFRAEKVKIVACDGKNVGQP